ncbi:hypothetical protein CHUAL_013418 [Chamberlinius hualienensis]
MTELVDIIEKLIAEKLKGFKDDIDKNFEEIRETIGNIKEKDVKINCQIESIQEKQNNVQIQMKKHKKQMIKFNAKNDTLVQMISQNMAKFGEIDNQFASVTKEIEKSAVKSNLDFCEINSAAITHSNESNLTMTQMEENLNCHCNMLIKDVKSLKTDQKMIQDNLEKLKTKKKLINRKIGKIDELKMEISSMSNRVDQTNEDYDRKLNVVQSNVSDMKSQLLSKTKEMICEQTGNILETLQTEKTQLLDVMETMKLDQKTQEDKMNAFILKNESVYQKISQVELIESKIATISKDVKDIQTNCNKNLKEVTMTNAGKPTIEIKSGPRGRGMRGGWLSMNRLPTQPTPVPNACIRNESSFNTRMYGIGCTNNAVRRERTSCYNAYVTHTTDI